MKFFKKFLFYFCIFFLACAIPLAVNYYFHFSHGKSSEIQNLNNSDTVPTPFVKNGETVPLNVDESLPSLSFNLGFKKILTLCNTTYPGYEGKTRLEWNSLFILSIKKAPLNTLNVYIDGAIWQYIHEKDQKIIARDTLFCTSAKEKTKFTTINVINLVNTKNILSYNALKEVYVLHPIKNKPEDEQ